MKYVPVVALILLLALLPLVFEGIARRQQKLGAHGWRLYEKRTIKYEGTDFLVMFFLFLAFFEVLIYFIAYVLEMHGLISHVFHHCIPYRCRHMTCCRYERHKVKSDIHRIVLARDLAAGKPSDYPAGCCF